MSGPKPQPRVPMEPLISAMIPDGGDPELLLQEDNPMFTRQVTMNHLARRLGTNRGSINRWLRDGLPIHTADKFAIMINRHPADIWPDYYDWSEHDEDADLCVG